MTPALSTLICHEFNDAASVKPAEGLKATKGQGSCLLEQKRLEDQRLSKRETNVSKRQAKRRRPQKRQTAAFMRIVIQRPISKVAPPLAVVSFAANS
jgi:hypothetical protein